MVRLGTVLAVALAFAACNDSSGSKGGDGGAAAPDAGLMPVDAMRAPHDMAPPHDAAPPADMAAPPLDMGSPPADMAPPPDMGPAPDVGPLDGMMCDPRLRARSTCGAGQFCVHVPGTPPHIGRCQMGDGCTVGQPCMDPQRPYCAVRGAATVCTAPGALAEGDPCVNELGIPQPCGEGLVCDFSHCVKSCTPGAMPTNCPDEGRCADVSELLGAGAGFCAPRGCNWFTGDGCEAGQKCSYAIRNDGVLVGSCVADQGANQVGAPCQSAAGGGDNCAQGLLCIGAPDQQKFCRILCDTGGYEAPCPAGMVCTESLATRLGPVHGYGICITNQ